MDPFTLTGGQFGYIVISGYIAIRDFARNPVFLVRHYGLGGVVLWIFGSGAIWRMEKQVLESDEDKVAMDFKVSIQNESNMIAVAGSILAQIAITALSLSNLSQVHWVARAFFTFSLVSAIIAVYYASDQYRILGRHLNCEDVKAWIRNDRLAGYGIDQYGEFMPSPAAVLTVSAPNMLLSASLNSFLLGLGTYLAYVWTRHLDTTASTNDSRAIFITYVVSLTVCYGIYELSGLVLVRRSYSTENPVNALRRSRRDEKSSNFQPASARVRGSTDGPGMSREHTVKDELIQELHIATQLRRESAASDERIAELLERLGQ